jgi:hypothetical protein
LATTSAEITHRAVQIHPPPGDFHICLVYEPAVSWDVPAGACRIDQQRSEPLNPAIDGHVIDGDATLGEQFFNVAVDSP